MKDGGSGASRTMHVRLMSLPLLRCSSLLPSISACETGIRESTGYTEVELVLVWRASGRLVWLWSGNVMKVVLVQYNGMNETLHQQGDRTNDTNLSLYLIAGRYNFLSLVQREIWRCCWFDAIHNLASFRSSIIFPVNRTMFFLVVH